METIKEFDNVCKPLHYNQGSIECIDAIRSALGDDGFIAYCKGNCIKYLWRSDFKNGVEDLQKCRWYLDKLIESKKDIDMSSAEEWLE